MIFDKLTLHDFGVYEGQQAIELTPASRKQPVILFGGLNGGGKTTLLDAIHLVLYGTRAKTSNRNGTAYPDYLRKCIHRGADAASITLEFSRRTEGKDHSYLVRRSWRTTGSGVRESLEVLKDNERDQQLTDSWPDYVEEFLPLGLSRLFLFDGEKIEALADLDHSSAALTTAINSLLGLDVIDQLAADLSTVEQRKKATLRNATEIAEIEALEARVKEHTDRLANLNARRVELQSEVDASERHLRHAEEQFRKAGGDKFRERGALEAEKTAVEHRIGELERELAEVASGSLPLLLARDLLASAAHQDGRELRASQAAALDTALRERDLETIAVLTAAGTSPTAISTLESHLAGDRERRASDCSTDVFLSFSAETSQQLSSLVTTDLGEQHRAASKLVAQFQQLQEALVAIVRKLQAVPDEAAISRYVDQREKALIAVEVARTQLAAVDQEIAGSTDACIKDRAKLETAMHKEVGLQFAREDTDRVLRYSAKVRSSLGKFRDAVVARHIDRIEQHVSKSFQQLLRKQGLIRSIKIDPSSFAVELLNRDGNRISPERLSAGERQLFAVSLLWGLAQAAGRPLPAVIDTPLGRLDASHRTHVIERYLPKASHQVLVLSTDSEIDRTYYKLLKPYIGREYRLVFDEKRMSTRVEEGYFW